MAQDEPPKKKAPKKKAAKKKAAPRKRGTRKAKAKVEVNLTVPEVKASGNARDRLTRLRLEAGFAYVQGTLEGVSVADVHRDPRFNGIAYKTLEKWADADKWTEKRRHLLAQLDTKLHDQLRNTLSAAVLTRVRDLQVVQGIARDWLGAIDETTGRPVLAPKSFGEAAKVLMTAGQDLDELRQQIAGDLLPGETYDPGAQKKQGQLASVSVSSDFDPTDLRAGAKAILAAKRARLRARVAEVDTEDA